MAVTATAARAVEIITKRINNRPKKNHDKTGENFFNIVPGEGGGLNPATPGSEVQYAFRCATGTITITVFYLNIKLLNLICTY